ncbi:MAG: thiamine phosphate synthase [Chthoniobacteraceae bacterium]|jgi:thiamine-phosphate pyrophosphorylase
MKRLDEIKLYGIVDLAYVSPADVMRVAAQMIDGGVDIIQLRAKKFIPADVNWLAEQVHPVTSAAGVPFVINDYPDVAAAVGAEGVHVGQDDMPVAEARNMAGYRTMIGKSTHSLAQAMSAAEEDVDYLGFGPIYATGTKPEYAAIGLKEIRKVTETVKKPVFCIGGIKLENLGEVLEAGARRVAIVSGILQAEDIAGYCRKVRGMMG